MASASALDPKMKNLEIRMEKLLEIKNQSLKIIRMRLSVYALNDFFLRSLKR